MKTDAEPGPCPVAPAAEVVFNRWTTDILWTLLHRGTLRFSELRTQVPGVTAKVLAERLRRLEQNGLVTRAAFAEMPPRVEYTATPLASTLVPVFSALEAWSLRHGDEIEAARRAYRGPRPS